MVQINLSDQHNSTPIPLLLIVPTPSSSFYSLSFHNPFHSLFSQSSTSHNVASICHQDLVLAQGYTKNPRHEIGALANIAPTSASARKLYLPLLWREVLQVHDLRSHRWEPLSQRSHQSRNQLPVVRFRTPLWPSWHSRRLVSGDFEHVAEGY